MEPARFLVVEKYSEFTNVCRFRYNQSENMKNNPCILFEQIIIWSYFWRSDVAGCRNCLIPRLFNNNLLFHWYRLSQGRSASGKGHKIKILPVVSTYRFKVICAADFRVRSIIGRGVHTPIAWRRSSSLPFVAKRNDRRTNNGSERNGILIK